MNRHYDNYLVKKYPPLYKNRYSDPMTTCMCWGFEIGDGWFNIINNLSYMLCQDWFQAKYQYDFYLPKLEKTKYDGTVIDEKFINDLKQKIKIEENKIPTVVQVKEKFGSLRYYVDGSTDAQYDLIDFAEKLSSVTCEVCGTPGKIKSIGGWYSCRCHKHSGQII